MKWITREHIKADRVACPKGVSDEERLVRQFLLYDALYEYARQTP